MPSAEDKLILMQSEEIMRETQNLIKQRCGLKPRMHKHIDTASMTVSFWAHYGVVDSSGNVAWPGYGCTVTYEYLLDTNNPEKTAYYLCDMLIPEIEVSP